MEAMSGRSGGLTELAALQTVRQRLSNYCCERTALTSLLSGEASHIRVKVLPLGQRYVLGQRLPTVLAAKTHYLEQTFGHVRLLACRGVQNRKVICFA